MLLKPRRMVRGAAGLVRASLPRPQVALVDNGTSTSCPGRKAEIVGWRRSHRHAGVHGATPNASPPPIGRHWRYLRPRRIERARPNFFFQSLDDDVITFGRSHPHRPGEIEECPDEASRRPAMVCRLPACRTSGAPRVVKSPFLAAPAPRIDATETLKIDLRDLREYPPRRPRISREFERFSMAEFRAHQTRPSCAASCCG